MSTDHALKTGHRSIYSDVALSTDANTHLREPDVNHNVRAKKTLACTSCRQRKIKCIGLRPGSKCEACRRRSSVCQVDPLYKRTTEHKVAELTDVDPSKLRELSDEVAHLKTLLSTHPTTSNSTVGKKQWHGSPEANGDGEDESLPADFANRNQNTTAPSGASAVELTEGPAALKFGRGQDDMLQATWTATDRALEDVGVNAASVSELFKVFYHHFHPHIPLLNNRVAIDKYFQLSPVLFWTVLAVATRCWKMQPDLHRRLRGPLMQLLWTSISAVPVSHFTIQAILLLCTWPFSPDSLISDPTFVLVSTARTACMQLGVHRPKQMQDYHRVRFEVRREQVREAVMIWVTCFIVAESVTSGEGHDPLFAPEDHVLAQAAGLDNCYDLPAILHQRLRCCMIVHQLRSTMAQNGHDVAMLQNSSLSPVLRLAEHRLHDVESEMSRSRSSPEIVNEDDSAQTADVVFRCAKLQICILYLHEHLMSSDRHYGLVRAFDAAMQLIDLFRILSTRPDFHFATQHYFSQNLKLAALLLLKLRFSTASRLFDIHRLEQSYDMAVSMHRKMVIHENDFDARAAIILTELWKICLENNGMLSQEPVLTLTSRGGASLLYESQWQWRDYYAAAMQDHRHQNRPPGILPSIILHSPQSLQTEGHDQNARPGPVRHDATQADGWSPSSRARVDDGDDFATETEQFDHGFDRQTCDPLPDALELMYAYLNPDEEALQLLYPPWTSDWEDLT